MQPPTISRNLGPGSQGDDVKQLQEWLKTQGYFPNQATTTNYGPITQKAVAAWQQAKGIDTAGNPGYFGPVSMKWIAEKQQATPTDTTVPTDSKTGKDNPQSDATLDANKIAEATTALSKYFTPEQIASIPDSQKAIFAGMSDVLTKQFESGRVSSFDVNEAYKLAKEDPDIQAKYGESLKIGEREFTDTLASYQSQLTQGQSDTARKFKEDQKNLSEAEAAAGRTYSGFSGQAKEKLKAEESSIIQSSRRSAQEALQKTQSEFEKKYGTNAVKPASLSFYDPLKGTTEAIGSTPIGGITGSDVTGQKSDVLSKQKDLLTLNN